MKLMVDKPEPMKFPQDHGACWVRGGKLWRVVAPHSVDLKGADVRPPQRGEAPRFEPGQKYTTAAVGDLVIEIVSVKDYYAGGGRLLAPAGAVLGWAYASGVAINLHRYTFSDDPLRPDWLEPAVLMNASPAMHAVATPEEAGATCLSMRMADADVVAFLIETKDAHMVAQSISEWLTADEVLEPGQEPHVRRSEVMGIVRDGNRKRGNQLSIHLQVPSRIQPWASSRMVIGLCGTSQEAVEMSMEPFEAKREPHLRSVP